MADAIRVDGLRDLQRELRALSADAAKELQQANKAAAEIVAQDAKTRVPRRTGRLRQSVRATATQRAGSVKAGGARVPYAKVIHFGWPARRIRPQPFLYEARDRRVTDVVKVYEQRVAALVSKINR